MNTYKTTQWRVATQLPILRHFFLGCSLFLLALPVMAQDEAASQATADKPVRSTFEGTFLLDNQSVMVPVKGTFEFQIQHRFGTMGIGVKDLFGMYAPSNIRLGFAYAPIDKLSLGFGFSKKNLLLDFSAKYGLLKQYEGWRMPVSVTYYGNMAINPSAAEDITIYHPSDRISYFHQLIIARKFNKWLSVQIAPSLSHYNLQTVKTMKNDHFAISFGIQAKVKESMAIIFNVDQPITQHDQNNPNPNMSLGLQMSTSGHNFQIFIGNFDGLIPQENNMYNDRNPYKNWNDFSYQTASHFRIGFNITRASNY
jgi:hypothetical protein